MFSDTRNILSQQFNATSFQWKSVVLAALMCLCTVGLGFIVEQNSFPTIALYYSLFFGAYAWVNSVEQNIDLKFWLFVAIGLRLILVFSFPHLSDDIYRFVWDGRLWLAAYNPFDHLPSWYIEQGIQIKGLTPTLFEQLNSPDYYTIYPPVAQLTFVISSWLSPNSIFGTAIIMKMILLLADIGSIILLIRLLNHWKLPVKRVLWYALNPLLIIEIMGNLHFEAVMIFFLLLALWLLVESKYIWSATAMALTIASKLLPLMFLPFLIKRLGWKRSFQYFAVVGLVLIACWIPLLNASFIENFGSSLDLYYRRFEFNASFYYLLRWWGYVVDGHNLIAFIGPLLALIVLSVILIRAYRENGTQWINLPTLWLFSISFYLAYATTIHPWYVALPLVLCLFTDWRWPIVWSGLIWLTYINYSYDEYYENLWIVAFEYIILISFGLWEAKKTKASSMNKVRSS